MEEHVDSAENVCFEGNVTFISRLTTVYRYRIIANGDIVKFWLEDRQSKHQWESDELTQKDLALFNSGVVSGSLTDYVSIFQNCLKQPTVDSSNECQRRLLPDYGGALALEFSMSIPFQGHSWNIKYRFTLKPIPLEPIEIAEAKLQDLQEELSQTRFMLNDTTERLHNARPLMLECDTNTSMDGNGLLQWKRVCDLHRDKGTNYILDPSGTIHIHRPGAYWVSATLYHEAQNTNDDVLFTLRLSMKSSHKNHKDFPIRNYGACSNQLCLLVMAPNQELSVLSASDVKVDEGSALVILPVD